MKNRPGDEQYGTIMKKWLGVPALYYIFPFLFFILAVRRCLHVIPDDQFALVVGEWEVPCFWFALCWFLIASIGIFLKGLLRPPAMSSAGWIALVLIVLAGFYARAFIAPDTHRLYFDEDIYLNIAQNIHSQSQALDCNNGGTEFGLFTCYEPILNKEPNGWPFLLSLSYNFSRSTEKAGRWLDIALGTACILIVFFLGSELFGPGAALWGAGIYALLPVPIQFSGTVEANTCFTLLLSAVIFLFVKAVKENDDRYLFPVYPLLCFTFQIRPEGVLIGAAALFFIFINGRGELLLQKRHAIFWSLLLILLVPYALHWTFSRHDNWGSVRGPMMSARYLRQNTIDNIGFFFDRRRFPAIALLLAIAGLAAARKNRMAVTALAPWIVVYFALYLFFYAGSYNYGVDDRYSLPIQAPIAVLAGAGAMWVLDKSGKMRLEGASVLAGLIAAFFIFQLPFISTIGEEGWQSRTDHDFITRVMPSLPAESVIFTLAPSEVMAGGLHGIAAWRMEDDGLVKNLREAGDPIYYYTDSWCSTPEYQQQCKDYVSEFRLKPLYQSQSRDQKLVLYELEGRKTKRGS